MLSFERAFHCFCFAALILLHVFASSFGPFVVVLLEKLEGIFIL